MKTTILGIATIVAAVSSAVVSFLQNGDTDFGSLVVAITAGIGLIKAADSKPKP